MDVTSTALFKIATGGLEAYVAAAKALSFPGEGAVQRTVGRGAHEPLDLEGGASQVLCLAEVVAFTRDCEAAIGGGKRRVAIDQLPYLVWLQAARERVASALTKLLKKHRDDQVILVLPDPLATIIHAMLASEDVGDLWKSECQCCRWEVIDVSSSKFEIAS